MIHTGRGMVDQMSTVHRFHSCACVNIIRHQLNNGTTKQ